MSIQQHSGQSFRHISILGFLSLFALGLYASPVEAVGTTSDFGKDLERTTSLRHFQVDRKKFIGQRFEFNCPAKLSRDIDRGLFGTGVYPADSPLCVAAQHAGAIDTSGGSIVVQLLEGRSSYEGGEQNGVISEALPGTALSIMFVTEETRAQLDGLQQEAAPRLKWDDKFSQTGLANIRLTGQRFAFTCPAAPQNLKGRRVYGTDLYPLNAYVCLSAVHAGQIDTAGGTVLVQLDPAPETGFVGSIRNGIESKNGPKSVRGISFPGDRR